MLGIPDVRNLSIFVKILKTNNNTFGFRHESMRRLGEVVYFNILCMYDEMKIYFKVKLWITFSYSSKILITNYYNNNIHLCH